MPVTQIQSAKAAAHKFFPYAWNTGDLSTAADIISPEFVDHYTHEQGVESAVQLITQFRTAFPDLKFSLEDEIAEGDKVVHRWAMSGTQMGELMGIPPTGKAASWTGTTTFKFRGGKIVERWANVDVLGIFIQLGVVSPPSA